MKKTFYFVGVCSLVLATQSQAVGQIMIPSCPQGYHVEILNSDTLSALQNQAMTLDASSDDLRKKQQAAKTTDEATQDQLAAQQADQDKSAAVSAMLAEQGRNMRCIPNS
jgi:hypothetical protein